MIELVLYLPFLSALAAAGLGIFVLLQNRRDITNISFFCAMVILSCQQVSEYMVLVSGSALWTTAFMISRALMPIPWMVFALTFARQEPLRSVRRYLPLLAAAALALLAPAALSLKDVYPLEGRVFVRGWSVIFHAGFLLSFVFSLTLLETTLRTSRDLVRWHIKYFIIGVGAIMALYVFLSSQILLYMAISLKLLLFESIMTLFSIPLIAFSLVRYRLLDSRVFVSRHVVYRSVVVLVTGVYLIGMGLLGEVIRRSGYGGKEDLIYWSIVAVASTGLIALFLSEGIRRRVKVFIDKHFYGHRYDYRSQWLELTKRLASKDSPEDLYTGLLQFMKETIGAKNGSLWLFDEEKRRFQRIKDIGIPLEEEIYIGEGFRAAFGEGDWIIDVQHITERERPHMDGDVWRVLRIFKATLVVPLSCGKEILGFVILGQRMGEKGYTYEDYDILKAISREASAFLMTRRLAEELSMARQMEVFHRLSSFVIHDLKNVITTLSLSLQNARHYMDNPEFQRDLLRNLEGSVFRMERLIRKLSTGSAGESRKEMVDLNAVVEAALSRCRFNGTKPVTIIKDLAEVPPIEADPEEMEKVVTNLLINAYEAIEERGEIRVSTTLEDEGVGLIVSDNGCGMSREFMERSLFRPFSTTKKKGLGIGLYHCKHIIEAHGGRIHVESRQGEGTVFKILFPAKGVISNGEGKAAYSGG